MVVRIRIMRQRKPTENTVEDELEWLCSSLGFCEAIDRDRTAQNIFKQLIRSSHDGKGLKSDDLADIVGKSRGAVVNHLNKLISSGLVVRRGTRYEMRENTLHNTIAEMRRDMDRIFEDMEKVADEIDRQMRGE
ncbi:MAG: ArsR family transcriptional regulator [Candidatus Altiarchaeales archaeon]|nr:ArsR family transcriptional regulator [Candidatus Altiarchaeales archaeon]MBD3416602.1 ArsR family transcriptional regulator [Candidatus Altiarchaeales archaeon]